MEIIMPKALIHPKELTGRLFFLAGPILGGDDWQTKAIDLVYKKEENCSIAVPFVLPPENPFYNFRVLEGEACFNRRLDWERFYLENACRIIFYLPRESKINPRLDGNPYARDTYGELGEWRGRMIGNPNLNKVFIGAEFGFPGLDVIYANFKAVRNDFIIYPSLEETIEAALG